MPAKHDTNGVEVPGTRWNGDEHDGTKWVPAGQGATVDDLLDAYCTKVGWWDRGHIADSVWKLHMDANEGDRTNLALTGSPLNDEDLKRIAECEVERLRPAHWNGRQRVRDREEGRR